MHCELARVEKRLGKAFGPPSISNTEDAIRNLPPVHLQMHHTAFGIGRQVGRAFCCAKSEQQITSRKAGSVRLAAGSCGGHVRSQKPGSHGAYVQHDCPWRGILMTEPLRSPRKVPPCSPWPLDATEPPLQLRQWPPGLRIPKETVWTGRRLPLCHAEKWIPAINSQIPARRVSHNQFLIQILSRLEPITAFSGSNVTGRDLHRTVSCVNARR